MADPTNFDLTQGVPFARTIKVVDAKLIWANIGDLEVRSQLREGGSASSALVANLHSFMQWAFVGNDLVITWSMTGADVRTLPRGGFYNLLVSDAGAADARGIQALFGKITLMRSPTSGSGAT